VTGQSGVPVLIDHDALPPPPSRPIALAVPNISEGRDRATIEAIVEAVRLPGVRVLNVHSDADHNRSVLTVAGDPLALQDAMVALAWETMERIDLRRHRGVHPRIGALDLVPIVALTPDELPMACELATGIAQRIGQELALPVFRYGAIASDPARTRPHDFRRDGLDALTAAVEDGQIAPDDGPHRIHATAGAVMVGAREPLIAWNVWMPDATLDQVRAIAARVRESGGGPAGIRALGLYLAEPGVAQVSMNLEDFRRTPPAVAVAAVRREAERLGIEAGDSELVGLIPAMALRGPSPSALRLMRFHPGQVLEAQLSTLRRQPPRRD
jgi:glutamate formiminotransferase/glutamate formiminotransferase/formiminotetrahydrofolate cyclodeaminase